MRPYHQLLLTLLLSASAAATGQERQPAVASFLASHVQELKQEMIEQLSRFHSCAVRARFITSDNFAPFGGTTEEQIAKAQDMSFLVTLVAVGRGMRDQGILTGSVIATCRRSLNRGDQTVGPLVLLMIEAPNIEPVTVNVVYRPAANGGFEYIGDDIILPGSPLVVK